MKAAEFDALVRKFKRETRYGRDLRAWLEHEGQIVARTRRSKGNKEVPFNLVRQQLHLDERQMREAIRCPLTLEGLPADLRDKGVI